MSEPEREFLKEWDRFLKAFDNRVENKVNAVLVKHLGIKWQSLIVILTVMGLYVGLLIYVNDITIKSSIKTSMSEYTETLSNMDKRITNMEKIMSNREPKSIGPATIDAKIEKKPAKTSRMPTRAGFPVLLGK